MFAMTGPGAGLRSLRVPIPLVFPFQLRLYRRMLIAQADANLIAPGQIDETWVAAAEYVQIEPVILGRFTTSLVIEDFVLKATK
jgi:hypothetical protein